MTCSRTRAIQAGAQGLTAPGVVSAFVVAAAALAAFLAIQARGKHPMMPLGLFRSRNVTVAVAVGFAFMVGYYGLPFVMSLYLQQLRGRSPAATGVAFLPMMVIGAALTPFSAHIAERLGARVLITGGLMLMTAGLVIIGLAPSSAPTWLLAAVMVLFGCRRGAGDRTLAAGWLTSPVHHDLGRPGRRRPIRTVLARAGWRLVPGTATAP